MALQNVKDDPAFDTIASRLLVKTLYKRIFGEGVTRDEVAAFHGSAFVVVDPARRRARAARHPPGELFDLEVLGAALDPRRDDLLRYIGAQTMRTRYMICEPDGTPLEVPQFFWMRVAMGLSLNEEDPTAAAMRFYDKMSRLEYLAAGSTLVNAGTSYAQLSNCFVMQMEDDIEHIAKSVRDVMWLTKGTGGIGLSVSQAALRGLADPVQQHHLDRPDPVHAHDRLDAARDQPRRQEVRRAVLLHGELAPRLRRSSSTCDRTPATPTAAPAPPTRPSGSPTSS